MTRKTPYNSTYKKLAVQCSADTFVVNQSLVLRINICGENPHLRQATKRYRKLPSTTQIMNHNLKMYICILTFERKN